MSQPSPCQSSMPSGMAEKRDIPPTLCKHNSSSPRPGLSQERERRGLVFRPPGCWGLGSPAPTLGLVTRRAGAPTPGPSVS